MNALANLPRTFSWIATSISPSVSAKLSSRSASKSSPAPQAAYALTMLEWNAPAAILCATNLREMGALEMAPFSAPIPTLRTFP